MANQRQLVTLSLLFDLLKGRKINRLSASFVIKLLNFQKYPSTKKSPDRKEVCFSCE